MDKPAIEGGKPVRNEWLPYGKQWLDEKDIHTALEVLRSDFITQGPMIRQFEEAIARYVGAKYAVAFSNGTAALHGACFAADIQQGDEVITTPITFAASSNAVIYQGGTPIFADIKQDTYNLDPAQIEEKITNRTKAIIPVDFTGQPAEMDAVLDIARRYHLTVIEDAAHALGADYKGIKIGNWADMTMFSFHPVKHITTGEGGIIVTDNEHFYQQLRLFRNHGITKDADLLVNKEEGPWYYEMQVLGYNYRMTDIQAALGLSQVSKLDDFIVRRKQIVEQYNRAFRSLDGITIPYQHPLSNSSWHLYVIRFDFSRFHINRKKLFEALQAENIGVQVHYMPVYYHPFYQQMGYSKSHCEQAEQLYEEIISLPLFPKMTDQDISDTVLAVQKIHAAYYSG